MFAQRNSYTALETSEASASGGGGSKGSDSVITARGSRMNAEAQTRRRIQSDRIKTIISLGGLVMLVLSSAMFGMGLEQFNQVSTYKGRGLVVLALSQTMAALMEEAAHSVTFTDPSISVATNDDHLTDRERATRLTTLHTNTRLALEGAMEKRQQHCPTCDTVLAMFNFAELLVMQRNVLMRLLKPEEVHQQYAALMRQLLAVMAAFTGWGVETGVASIAWTEQLLLASRGVSFIHTGWLDAYATQSLTERRSFNYMSIAKDNLKILPSFSPLMASWPTVEDVDERWRETSDAIAPPTEATEALLSTVSGSFAGLQTAGAYTPEEAVARTIALYRGIIDTVGEAAPWNDVTLDEWKWIMGLSVSLMVCGATILVLGLRNATLLVWAAETELAQMKSAHQLESSLVRMHRLLDSMFRLDREGIVEAVELSTSCGQLATNAERELLQLASPAQHVLSFVNPCVLDRCVAARQADGDLCSNKSEDPVTMGLARQYLTLVLVDLRCFANTLITGETCRTLPKELLVFLNDIGAMVAQCGGTILGISGTVLTIAWNVRVAGESSAGAMKRMSNGGGELAHGNRGRRAQSSSIGQSATSGSGRLTTDTPENDACHMLLQFRLKKLQLKYPKVRFSVVSGVCSHGVVGSSTTRGYVVAGEPVMLGRVLLEGARFHGITSVTDTTTFLKLDTVQFCKRALEEMGINGESKNKETARADKGELASKSSSSGNKTVVYELTITGAELNEYALLWNAAFDDYNTQHFDEARRKLQAWRKLFGDRPTYKRAMHLLAEWGQSRQPVFYRPTGTADFECNLII